ncbi:MAG: YeeE/YedE family protein [Prosthecobacter sp.]|jgi:uncharacterized membrane protein YedE/YeeE|uniref:YeeE/YedE thiosulfate transporter family protein n=1 Tax=Prosthecobacter sp. TaxID=1965333 RepID=UPI0019F13363|nr:YeeE/YedE thiosulfate transporter family protein [Prosthecobacter sp.]MBE2285865.1 YeeE/YedE family protein [Prosthecobacter sp.]
MKSPRWNPYLVGALIGVLSLLTFSLADKPIGMSTGIAQASGACAMPVIGADGVAANAYWAKKAVPAWDYGSLFVLGSLLGALASAVMSGSFKLESVPKIWRERFGSSVMKRMIAAFIGGVVILFGARLADGCTSGHGISGSLQLAVSSWTFFLVMFASGIVTAFVLFRRNSKA